jgi:hypothetical protein
VTIGAALWPLSRLGVKASKASFSVACSERSFKGALVMAGIEATVFIVSRSCGFRPFPSQ